MVSVRASSHSTAPQLGPRSPADPTQRQSSGAKAELSERRGEQRRDGHSTVLAQRESEPAVCPHGWRGGCGCHSVLPHRDPRAPSPAAPRCGTGPARAARGRSAAPGQRDRALPPAPIPTRTAPAPAGHRPAAASTPRPALSGDQGLDACRSCQTHRKEPGPRPCAAGSARVSDPNVVSAARTSPSANSSRGSVR